MEREETALKMEMDTRTRQRMGDIWDVAPHP